MTDSHIKKREIKKENDSKVSNILLYCYGYLINTTYMDDTSNIHKGADQGHLWDIKRKGGCYGHARDINKDPSKNSCQS